MQYLLLIYSAESDDANQDRRQADGRLRRLHPGHRAERRLQVRRPAEARRHATTVRVRDGKTLTTDGPFAETREQLGGYYLVEAKDLDEAIAIAAKVPTAKHGSIEVRPVWAM